MRNEAASINNEISIAIRKQYSNLIGIDPTASPQQKEGKLKAVEEQGLPLVIGNGAYRAKRRRTRAPSPFSPNGSSSKEGSLAEFDTIREMRIKIEQQSRALASLSKENEEVSSSIQ